MTTKRAHQLVREGDIVAEVAVEQLEGDSGWAPYLSVEDAKKLDDVRAALRAGDIQRATTLADRVYRLTPLSISDVR